MTDGGTQDSRESYAPAPLDKQIDDIISNYENRVATYTDRFTREHHDHEHLTADLEYAKQVLSDGITDLCAKAEKKGREASEIWKPYTTYPFTGQYEVSTAGRVRRNGKILKQSARGHGYLCVSLCENNKSTSKNVHRLVAETFIINATGKRTVNHIDGDKQNNCVNNLEWATYAENEFHSFHTLGKEPWNKGTTFSETRICCVCMKEYQCTVHKKNDATCSRSCGATLRYRKLHGKLEADTKVET